MTRLAIQHVGSGDQAVGFLHGFLGSGRNLRTLATAWVEQDPSWQAFWLDLPGHGNSPNLLPGATLYSMGRQVLDTLRDTGKKGPWTLVGHSLGGRVALAASSLPDSDIRKVVLLDIAAGPISEQHSNSRKVMEILKDAPHTVPTRNEMLEFLTQRTLSTSVAQWLMMNLVKNHEGHYAWKVDLSALAALLETVNATDLWTCVEHRATGLDMLCVRGGKSSYVTSEDVARFQKAGCPVFTLEGAGHDVHIEASQAVLDILRRT